MSAPELVCADPAPRRKSARARALNGIDFVEVQDADRPVLTAMFLEKAPAKINKENVRIDGGRRVRGLEVVDVEVCRERDQRLDDCLRITLDRRGDASTYTLRLVEPGTHGRPGTRSMRGFDRRYASAPFSFAAPCRTGLDCVAPDDCPPETFTEPVLSYLAKDYASFRALLLERLANVMPDWVERHVPDLGITLVELLAYVGDYLSYYQDAVATEAYLDTARQRISVRRHLRLIDYRLDEGCNARAWVVVGVSGDLELGAGDFRFVTGPPAAGQRPVLREPELAKLAPGSFEVFEPVVDAPVELRAAHTQIEIWTWGEDDCCLPAGATSATLLDQDRGLALQPGDVLVFEEVKGPRTGNPADADPRHRQAVRLTAVAEDDDEVLQRHVLEVSWAPEDALRFPLCLSAVGPDCRPLTGISLARGNAILVDHGRSIAWCGGDPETVDVPPRPLPDPECAPCAEPAARLRFEALLQRLAASEEAVLTPSEIAYVKAVVGARAASEAGIDKEGNAAQKLALEELLAVRAAFPIPFTARLASSPLTHREPFPLPRHVAAGQARHVAAVAGRARRWLDDLWQQAKDGTAPNDEQRAALTTIFGAEALHDAGLDDEATPPADALGRLRNRWKRLLAAKLRALEALARHARAGYVLGADAVADVGADWGEPYAAGLEATAAVLAGPACAAMTQDPVAALAALTLDELEVAQPGQWTVSADLLDSGPDDRHVVVEVDDDGAAHVRFGDDTDGRAVDPGTALGARYRIGNGRAGNVGAEAIARIVLCETHEDVVVGVRNPLAACGGTDPQAVADARRLAPLAIHHRLLRAVTAADYATLAAQVPGVQRAAATLAWNGSWYEADVAVDPLGTEELAPELRREVAEHLFPYRRVGHDLHVEPAHYVGIDLALLVCVAPHYRRGDVRRAILDVLGTRTLPTGRRGLFHPDELTLGGEVAQSAIVAAVQGLPGVVSVDVQRFERSGVGDRGERDLGVLRLSPLEVPRLDGDPDHPENGRLTLDVRGGR